ncbi:hypothetical protein EJB05_25717, partial [Eragrostis curvula]
MKKKRKEKDIALVLSDDVETCLLSREPTVLCSMGIASHPGDDNDVNPDETKSKVDHGEPKKLEKASFPRQWTEIKDALACDPVDLQIMKAELLNEGE